MKTKLKTKKKKKNNLEKIEKNKNFLNSQNYILGRNEKKKIFSKFFVENLFNSFGKRYYFFLLLLNILLLLFMYLAYLARIEFYIPFMNQWVGMDAILIPFVFAVLYFIFSIKPDGIYMQKKVNGIKKIFMEDYYLLANGFIIFFIIYFLGFLVGKNILGYSISDSEGVGSLFVGLLIIILYFWTEKFYNIKILQKFMRINLVKVLYFPFIFMFLYFLYLFFIFKGLKSIKNYKIIKYKPQTKFLEKFDKINGYLAYNNFYKISKKRKN